MDNLSCGTPHLFHCRQKESRVSRVGCPRIPVAGFTRNRWLASPGIGGWHQPESVAAIAWNTRQLQPEWVATFSRNRWPTSAEYATNLDHDPSTEGFTVGNTGPGRTTSGPIKLRAAVFMEVIRDVLEAPPPFVKPRQSQKLVALSLSPDFGKRVTAHELLHAFELFHDEGIMCGGINIQDRPDGGRLTAKQVAVLRKQRGPAFSNDTRETCQ